MAGEIAAEPQDGITQTPGPGTARVNLIDALHSIGDAELARVSMKSEMIAND